MSVAAPTTVVEVDGTELHRSTVSPEDVGLSRHDDHAATMGGGPQENAAITRAILSGEHGPGTPTHDLAILNAGAAVYAGGAAGTLREGVEQAAAAVADGRAAQTLERLILTTQELAPA